MTIKLRIGTFNARGLRDNQKRQETFIWLKRQKLDIVFLQETHSDKKIENYWKHEWGGKAWFASYKSTARGVGILLNRDIDGKILEVDRDKEGRWLIVKLEFEKKVYLLVNNYGPNIDNPDFFYQVAKKIQDFTYDHLIWGGDFNTILDNSIDRNKGLHQNKKSMEYLNILKESMEIIDV